MTIPSTTPTSMRGLPASDIRVIHTLLQRDLGPVEVVYDGARTLTAGPVRVSFTQHWVAISFPDAERLPDDPPVTVTVTYGFTYGALCTLVAGIWLAVDA